MLFRSTSLKANQVSLTDGSLGTTKTLQTDAAGALVLPDKISVAMTTSSSVIGEAAMITYPSLATTTFKVFAMDSTGTVLGLGTLNTGHSFAADYGCSCNIYIEPTVNQNRFWLATCYAAGTTEDVYSQSWTFTTSAYTSVYSKVTVGSFTAWTSGGTEPTSKHWNNLTHAIDRKSTRLNSSHT